MTSYTEQYLKQIYPMQDLVLQTVRNCSTPFYLTGGTALNRAFVNIRYSDDLDFFVNNDDNFSGYVNLVTEKLIQVGFDFDEKTLIASNSFVSMFLTNKNYIGKLKIDFVNDIPAYFGSPIKTSLFDRTDCIENILTNKLSALIGRSEVKDVVDLLSISKNFKFSWSEAIKEAEQKESSMDTALIAGIICETTENAFNTIKWIKKPEFHVFRKELEVMAKDILCLGLNSLCKQ